MQPGLSTIRLLTYLLTCIVFANRIDTKSNLLPTTTILSSFHDNESVSAESTTPIDLSTIHNTTVKTIASSIVDSTNDQSKSTYQRLKIDNSFYAKRNGPSTDEPESLNHYDIHQTFLLMCSANSIRYWSFNCSEHSSGSLIQYDRSSSLSHGITSIAVWNPISTNKSAQLIWYDVANGGFHYGTLWKEPDSTASCDRLLSLELKGELEFTSNPYVKDNLSKRKDEKLVYITIDNDDQLLFASNYIQGRIDLYRLNSVEFGRLDWIQSVDSFHPINLIADHRTKTLVWLEDRTSICQISYSSLRLSTKSCIPPNELEKPQSLTIDDQSNLIWSNRNGHLYRSQINPNVDRSTIGQIDEDVNQIDTMIIHNGTTLFYADQQFIHKMDLLRNLSRIVSIESYHIFELTLLDASNIGFELPNLINETKDSNTTTSTKVTLTVNIVDQFISNNLKNGQESRPIGDYHLSTFICLILFFLMILAVAIFIILRKRLLSNIFPAIGRKYAKLRSDTNSFHSRTDSIISDPLIDDDCWNDSIEADRIGPINRHFNRTTSNYFNQNIAQSHPISVARVGDIEDMFGGSVSTRPMNRTMAKCLTCRESETCQDKGLCMATYRVL